MENKQSAACLVDNYIKSVDYLRIPKATEDCRFIYLFRNPTFNLCKIGITNNWLVRIRQLENSTGMKLQDLIVLELEPEYDERPKDIEKYIHNYFKEKRKEGEWFDLSVKDILAIKNLFYEIHGMDICDNIKEHLLKSNGK